MPGPEYFKARRAARNDRFPPGSPAREARDADDAEEDADDARPKRRPAGGGRSAAPSGRGSGPAHPLAAAKAQRSATPAGGDKPVHPAKAAKTPKADKPAGAEAKPRGPQVDGEGKPYITLAQLLKAQALTGTGAEAKHLIRNGGIKVNGEAENRPGRKLHDGDVVQIAGDEFTVAVAAT
jgi:ribosome-associated protein